MKDRGFTNAEIAESVGRTETSIAIKTKRMGKSGDTYNDAHRDDKYKANREFFDSVHPQTIIDAYCGIGSWWLANAESATVITNDIDTNIDAAFHLPSDKLMAKLYSENRSFDVIDLDPFGSAYDSFDLAIKMAKKGIIITFGEMGHKRWKRLDFVRYHYGITDVSDFTTQRLIDEVLRIGRCNKKELIPTIVKEWPRISRVYFEIRPLKVTEQWKI